jgi:hypothetical protein
LLQGSANKKFNKFQFLGIQFMKNTSLNRRQLLSTGVAAVVAVPVLFVATDAMANQNAKIRTSLKFQGTPNGEKECSKCSNFLPNAADLKASGCKLYPGDNEIPPTGYCMGFVLKKA